MALFPIFILILIAPSSTNAQWPPSPGYWPSSRFRSMSFYQGYRNLWGYSHQRVEQNALTIWLDRTSGSGFKSVNHFDQGILLPPSSSSLVTLPESLQLSIYRTTKLTPGSMMKWT
uniref:Legume lectin domain-containing protein n=1 Tax=Salix viminalis TaxID=40686 RepID=A0A6N2K6X9_SALVM